MRHEHGEQVSKRFDDWADTYEENKITSWFRYYQTLALAKLEIDNSPGFLEVGCGTGWAVRQASKRLKHGTCCGIDISPKMISVAKKQSSKHSNIVFNLADAQSIPYPDDSFSFILCTNSFHHYQDPKNALNEIKRVLKTGGKFVLLDPARDVSFPIWCQDRFRRYFERGHVKYYTTNEMKDLLKATELKIIDEIKKIRRFMDHGKLFTGLMLIRCLK